MPVDEKAVKGTLYRAFAVPGALAAVLALLLVVQVRILLSLTDWVDHADRVIAAGQGVERLLVDRETGMRGFALTGDPQFLEPYASAERALPDRLQALSDLVADVPAQRERVDELAHLSREWREYAESVIAGVRLHPSGALERVRQGEGKRRMDRLRQLVASFIATEEQLRSSRTGRAEKVANWLMAGSAALAVLLGVSIALYTRRQLATISAHAERALDQARETMRLRDDFLTVAAHELRTPLTALQLQLQRLQRDMTRTAARDERSRPSVEMALRQTRRLSALVESLIDAYTFAAESDLELRRELVDVPLLVEGVVKEHAGEAERARCELTVRVPAGVVRAELDRRRVEQLVSALVANAIKYGPGSPVEVQLSSEVRSVRLTVRDHGIGIAGDRQATIFGRYGRAVSARAYGGFGLGLFAARRIAEAHGGTIDVASEAGQGATFTVVLPTGEAEEHAAALRPSA